MEGTTHLVDCTYVRKRVAAATLERQLLLLDAEGNLRWQADVPEDLKRIALSPLGDWLICGFADGRLLRLDCP
jgi:hypothetical protein